MRRALIIAGVGGVLAAVLVIAALSRDPLVSGPRRAWKEAAIAEISGRVADPGWVSQEMIALGEKAATDPDASEGWLSERLVLMRNGDWLAYASICRKEDSRIHDLFLGRGSDGRWYYSTFHFCRGMLVLRIEEQSEDLAGFCRAYFLREFDGHSDECLQDTWPPESR